jgi:cytochrome c biogenesis protein CcdA/DsbC/DsbD-like thiol-disulfide interchange protein/thiol-disulfide isomerase/thioredoxin
MRTRLLALLAVVIGLSMAQTPVRRVPPAEVTPLVERTKAHAGTTVRAALQVRLPDGLHAQSNKPLKPNIPTTLTFDVPAGVTVPEVVFPVATEITLPGYDKPLPVFEHDFVIGVQLSLEPSLGPGSIRVQTRLRYQACDDNQCFLPITVPATLELTVVAASDALPAAENKDVLARIAFGHGEKPDKSTPGVDSGPKSTSGVDLGALGSKSIPAAGLALLDDFTVQGAPQGGYLNAAEFLQFIHDAEANVRAKSAFEDRGPLAILLLVFVGGLALNLTPCVLPMIPINLAIIGAGTAAGRKGRGLMLGAVYGGAMALVYGVLGLVVILTAGTFGGINASPWFNAGIAVLFVVLGLAMFDIGVIDLSRFSSGIRFNSSDRGTLLLAFSMGAVAALLAGACVAPVVIQVVFFASNLYAGGNASALALPFVLGIGMAVPWPLAGAGIAALPKPGAWMNRVKYVFGAFILATAAYYGYEAYGLFANRWVDPASVRASVDAQLKNGWNASLADGLQIARRDGTPVLIDMWATWCKNCLTMDKTTLADPAVQQALAGYTKIKFQAEDLDASPAKDLASRFDVVGLPTYVILKPKAR